MEGASQAVFEFEVKHETQKKPPPDTSAETDRATGPDYDLIEGPTGGLTVEVPASWEVQTGANSEGEGSNWSEYAGESLTSSITTAPSLDAWYSTGSSGVYMVASKELAQYSDYELTHSMLFANKAENCARTGPYEDYNRPPYSGKMQTWYDCGQVGATTYAVAAAPEGRECVAVFDMWISDQAHREAVQHVLDSFKLDCSKVTSEALATASPTPSPEASASPTPTPSEPEPSQGADVVTIRVIGTPGERFSGNYGNIDTGRTVDGTIPAEYQQEVDTGFLSGDSVSAVFQKMSGGNWTLTVQLIYEGEVVKEATTTAQYGVVDVLWSPSE